MIKQRPSSSSLLMISSSTSCSSNNSEEEEEGVDRKEEEFHSNHHHHHNNNNIQINNNNHRASEYDDEEEEEEVMEEVIEPNHVNGKEEDDQSCSESHHDASKEEFTLPITTTTTIFHKPLFMNLNRTNQETTKSNNNMNTMTTNMNTTNMKTTTMNTTTTNRTIIGVGHDLNNSSSSRGSDSSSVGSGNYLLQSVAPRSKSKNQIIHEKQKRQLCAKHSINNLLQQRVETIEFDQVADCIFNTERDLYYGSFDNSSSRLSRWFKKKAMSNYHKKKILLLGSFGNYSYEVVESILTQKQMKLCNLKPTELNDNNLTMDVWNLRDPKIVGLIFNQQNYVEVGGGGCFPFFRSKTERRAACGHWWSVGKIILNDEREIWYNHDSQLREPIEINNVDNVYKYIYSLCKGNQDVLVWKVEG